MTNPGARIQENGIWRMVRGAAAAAVVLLSLTAATSRADVMEVRDYSVAVSGKHVGYSQLIITDKKDGTIHVLNRANVKVRFAFLTFNFAFQGTEDWVGYRLQKAAGKGNENRTKYDVTAELDKKKRMLLLTANKRARYIAANTWTSTFWRLPKITARTLPVPVLLTTRGETFNGKLNYLGTDQRVFGGRKQTCYRFRLTGGKKPIDLIFDAQHRLLQQQFVEMGRRTVISLTNIRRTRPAARTSK